MMNRFFKLMELLEQQGNFIEVGSEDNVYPLFFAYVDGDRDFGLSKRDEIQREFPEVEFIEENGVFKKFTWNDND